MNQKDKGQWKRTLWRYRLFKCTVLYLTSSVITVSCWRLGLKQKKLTWSISHFYSISTHRQSRVWLFLTPWTVTHQALLSMEFSRQEYRNRLPFPSPGDLPEPGVEPRSPTLSCRFFTIWATGENPFKLKQRSHSGLLKPLKSFSCSFNARYKEVSSYISFLLKEIW